VSEEKESKKKKRFWTSKRVGIAALIVFCLIVGAAIEHYLIEPVIGEYCLEDLRICKQQNQVLNEENQACYLNGNNSTG